MKFISTILGIYAALFILLSHTSIMTCRYGQRKMNVRGFNLKDDLQFVDKCPEVRIFKFFLNIMIVPRIFVFYIRLLIR